jgi:ankyrin repeat protein
MTEVAVKRLGSFGFFPHLEIGRLEETPAEILDQLDKAPLHEKLKQIKAVPKGELDTLLRNGNTLLHQAVIRHDLDFAEALLEAGAKVDSKSESGETPLSLATASRNQGMILLLVRYGVEPRSVDEAFRPTLLLYALSKEEPRMIEDLLKAGVRLDQAEEDYVVRRAISRNRRDILEIFVEHGFNIPDYCERCRVRGIAAFVDVEYDVLRYLLEHGAPPDQLDPGTEYTPLTFNAKNENVEKVDLLIRFRADVNAQLDGHSILSHMLQGYAIGKKRLEIAEMLFNAGAETTEQERTTLLNLLKRG